MLVELHLMDDVEIIKSVQINGSDYTSGVIELLNFAESVVSNYPYDPSDPYNTNHEVILSNIREAKTKSYLTVGEVVGFNASCFNIVFHAKEGNNDVRE